MGFKQYNFEESGKESEQKAVEQAASAANEGSFQYSKFEHDPDKLVLDTAETHVGRFKIHNLVESQLGLVAREQKKNEQIIAKEIEDRWIQTKEKAEVEGFTQGLNTGKTEAYKAEQPRIEEKLNLLDTLLTDLASQREFIFRKNEKFLMDLLSQVLRVIALKEIQLDPDYLERLVLHLLNQMSAEDDVRVLISEADFENIQRLRENIGRAKPELKNLTFEMRPEVEKGSCRLETKNVVIDASIEEQIRNAMSVFKRGEGDVTG